MAAFPSYAKLVLSGFAINRESALNRTDMDSGPPKQAPRVSRAMVARKATVALDSAADYTNFMAWFKTTVNLGAAWFSWIDPVDGVTKWARIASGQIDEEKPLNSALSLWQLSFKIETWG